METEIVEIGKISSRGQIAIPADIRDRLGLREGEKVLFLTEGETLIMKKVVPKTFAEITKPLKEAAKKSGLKEKEVQRAIKRFRKI